MTLKKNDVWFESNQISTRRISLTSPSPSSKSQASPASSGFTASQASGGFTVNGSPGLTREHQGSPGFTRSQQGSPGLTRTQQGSPRVSTQQFGSPGFSKARQGSPALTRAHQSASEFVKSQQSSHSGPSGPGLVNVVQGSPGDKASKRKAQGEGSNKSGGGGGKRGPYQRWEFLVFVWKKYANISFQCNANFGLQPP